MARPKGKTEAVSIGLRMPLTVNQLWTDLARHMGINKSATMVLALRELAKKEGVSERPLERLEEAAP